MVRAALIAILLAMACGSALYADLTPIGYISIDTDVPIGGIDTIGVGNLTGLTYGCSVPAGFQACADLTISGSITFQFQDGANIDTTIVPLATDLGPGLYDPSEFQFLDSATLISATFTGTISPTVFDEVLPDNSVVPVEALPDIVSSPLTPDQPLSLLEVQTVAMPEGPAYELPLMVLFLIGLGIYRRVRHIDPSVTRN